MKSDMRAKALIAMREIESNGGAPVRQSIACALWFGYRRHARFSFWPRFAPGPFSFQNPSCAQTSRRRRVLLSERHLDQLPESDRPRGDVRLPPPPIFKSLVEWTAQANLNGRTRIVWYVVLQCIAPVLHPTRGPRRRFRRAIMHFHSTRRRERLPSNVLFLF